MHEFQSEVFMIIGGCTKDEKFVAEVTCLDPLRRSRLEVAKLPTTEQEPENENRKWVEFACITLKNEVYISGKEQDINGECKRRAKSSHSYFQLLSRPCLRQL